MLVFSSPAGFITLLLLVDAAAPARAGECDKLIRNCIKSEVCMAIRIMTIPGCQGTPSLPNAICALDGSSSTCKSLSGGSGGLHIGSAENPALYTDDSGACTHRLAVSKSVMKSQCQGNRECKAVMDCSCQNYPNNPVSIQDTPDATCSDGEEVTWVITKEATSSGGRYGTIVLIFLDN
jgi:hypothetical protein